MLSPSFDKAIQHHRAGEFDKATALYRHVLRTARGQEASRVGQMLANALHQQGQIEAAEEALRAALRAEPAPALAGRRALSNFLASQARMGDALAIWREGVEAARAVGPAPYGEARIGLAITLSEARRTDEALKLISELAAEFPGVVPVQYELARLCERLGQHAEGRAAIGRVLAIAPDLVEAHLLMARLEALDGKKIEARARLTSLIETMPDERRGVPMMELAQLLDKAGEHAAAFEMAARGQAINFAALPAGRRDGRLHEHVMGECLKITAEGVAKWAHPRGGGLRTSAKASAAEPADIGRDADATTKSPAFIVGFPRSGTTLIEQMLSGHPNLAVTDEMPLLQRTREKLFLKYRPRGEYPGDLGEFSSEQVDKARAWYMERAANALGADRVNGKRIIDKQPLNTVDLCFIRLVFPESPIMFVHRDPRDVVLSCFMQGFARGVPHLFSLEGAARLYDWFMRVWEHYKVVLGQKWTEVKYEELVREPEKQARRLVEFIGEPWDDGVLRHHEPERRRYVITPSYADVGQPIYTRAVGKWSKYHDQLQPVMPVLTPWVERLGYGG